MSMFSTLSPQPVRFEPIWTGLADGVGKIVTMTGVKGMPLVEDVYKLCTAQPTPFSEELYLRLRDFLERHVDGLRESILQHQSDMLSDYLKKWRAYSIGCEYCNAIFRYLNNNWIRKKLEDTRNKLVGVFQGPTASTEVYEVFTLALVIWRDRLFGRIKDRVIRALLELIQKDRDGEQVNHSEIRGIIESYVKLGIVNKNKPLEIYKEDFEQPFIAATREYYARESASFIAANGVATYMKKAETRIEEEAVRGKRYLDSSSYDKLRKEVDQVLIERHKEALQAECEIMLKDDKQQDLSRMYHLLMRIDDGLRPMLDSLQSYTEAFGMEALKGLQQDTKGHDPKAYVECLLAIYTQFSDVVRKAFDNDTAFIAALDKACRKIINENSLNESSSKTPELLARHCDLLLKKGKTVLDDKQLEDKLNQIILIFKYVDDKDVFQKFYSKMLARRLIHGQSISGDMESFMIGGLKQVCGYEYTSKLQRMFTDMSTSIDLNDKFREAVTNKGIDIGKLDASILVLTAGSWPLSEPQSNFVVPQELELCITEFQKWYSAQSHGRKLNWLHQLSKADLRITYLKRKYEIQVMGYQIGVLLLFNTANDEGMTMEDIGKGMGVKDQELIRCVQTLVDAHILKKAGASKAGVQLTDTISLNKAFTSKRLKLKITAGVASETPQQHQATIESIEEDRKLYLQAAIVRIMKARKTLTHVQLVQETIQQSKSRFSPNIPMIKKCIEQLIEKEYLARAEGEANKYSYVA